MSLDDPAGAAMPADLTSDSRLAVAVEAFARAWGEGSPLAIEELLDSAPEGDRAELCKRLVGEELRLRLGSGEAPDLSEYRRRFPDSSGSIDAMLEALLSTRAHEPTDGDATTLRLPPDRPEPPRDWAGRVLGDYRILGRIGGGGMGAVYRARHAYLDCEMAVKVVLPDRQGHRGSVERFFREMRAVGRLDHPNIVRCNDAREVEGVPFLVMELLEGRDLHRLVAERGPLPVTVACELIRQAALGLSHAHERGLVHRDVKPSNLFLTDAGVLKVLDLGLSIVEMGEDSPGESAGSAEGLTVEGQALGTPDYMAPEQWTDALNADARADIYGLGATLYFLLGGRPPFVGHGYSTFHGKMQGHLNDTPPALCSLRPEVPIALAGVVDRALSKAPADRQASATEFAEMIRAFCAGADLSAWLADPGRPSLPHADPDAPTSVVRGGRPAQPTQVDEDVQFTVYRPKAVVPEQWRPLLVFAHLAERRPDAPPGEPDPVAEVRRQAEQVLGPAVDRFQPTTQESAEAIPRGDLLTFVPAVAGVEFNPASRSFAWVESVHREEFRFRAGRELDGQMARGRVSVFLGRILLAEIPIKFRVDAAHVEPPDEPMEPAVGRRFRRIYASFAGEDRAVAEEFEGFARLMGDEFLLGCASLRTADVWDDRVRERIRNADVFQLFWSSRALASPQVEREWQYALGLNRDGFIRPVYWEDPLPSDPGRDLPPEALVACEFQKLDRDPMPEPAAEVAMPAGETGLIGGRYRLLESLGEGRWRAEDVRLARAVLVEAAGTEVSRRPEVLGAFRRDFQRLASLRCPSVPAFYELLTEGETTYEIQEFIRGERLSERIRRAGALDLRTVRTIAEGICGAIEAAHGVGVIHGDLKPHNVFLTESGRSLKVVGLGREALRRSQGSRNLTLFQAPTVSIPHAAPEVMMGDPATPESDVFSIGAILLEALTGSPLASSPLERMQNFQKPAARIRDRNPRSAVPESVEQVVLRCLEFESSRRFGSASELRDALGRAWATGLPEPALVAPAWSLPDNRPAPASPGVAAMTPDLLEFDPASRVASRAARSGSRGRSGWLIAVALLVAVLLGVQRNWPGLKTWFGRQAAHVASTPDAPK